MPALVWLLVGLLPDDPAIRLGVAAVLLVLCTVHPPRTRQHRTGNSGSPLLLLVQLVALPLYPVLFFDVMILARSIEAGEIATAFGVNVLAPLVLAFVLERRARANQRLRARMAASGWLPVPLLAVVVFIINASQVHTVSDWLPYLGVVVFIAYLLIAGALGRLLAGLIRLDTGAARTLVFSLCTRNSFVVLPLALALPAGWEAVAVVIRAADAGGVAGYALVYHLGASPPAAGYACTCRHSSVRGRLNHRPPEKNGNRLRGTGLPSNADRRTESAPSPRAVSRRRRGV